MNHDFLKSPEIEGRASKEKNEITVQKMAVSQGEMQQSSTKNWIAFKILRIERQAKMNVIFNNIFLTLFFSIICLGLNISIFFNKSWYLMAETANYEYWVNTILIEKFCQTANTGLSVCQNSPNVYSLFMLLFNNNGCKYQDLTTDDPENLCSIMKPYFYAGIVASACILVGIVFHFVHISQLISLFRDRNPNDFQGLTPTKISYLIIFFYWMPFFYWIFASGSLFNMNSSLSIWKRFGSSFYCYFGSIILIIVLGIWFRKLYKKGVRKDLVTQLLDAEERYIHGIGVTSPNVDQQSPLS